MSAIERFEPESPLIGGDPEDAARIQAYYDFQKEFGESDSDYVELEQVVAQGEDLGLGVVALEDWHKSANCKGKGDLFFPKVTLDDKLKITKKEKYHEQKDRLRQAAELCASCMVRSQCDVRVV